MANTALINLAPPLDPLALDPPEGSPAPIIGSSDFTTSRISRWLTEKSGCNQVFQTSADQHLFSLCLRATRLELRTGAGATFDGIMQAGALHVTGPNRQIEARLSAPCDILHLHVPTPLLQARLIGMGGHSDLLEGLHGCTLSDTLVEQLARLLLSEGAHLDATYTNAITQTLLTRILQLAQNRTTVGALAKWRLRRVQAMVDKRICEPTTLSEMAAAAGLSRMHFAAQFKAATGFSPHEYLRCQRIEVAKALLANTTTSLAEIALDVGFLAQAHFTTVFKRSTGDTPARWRRAYRDAKRPLPGASDLRGAPDHAVAQREAARA
jgi:AraC family transcriptional regulator